VCDKADQVKRRINLLGSLGEKFGETHDFEIKTPAEAIRAFMANYPDFKKHLLESDSKGIGFKILVGKTPAKDEEELYNPSGRNEISIVPVVTGSGGESGGALKVFAGFVLVVVGIALEPVSAGASTFLIYAGVGLMLGGVVQLLTPIPKINAPEERPENKPSYLFSGVVNTTAQGQPIQLLFGRLTVGSAVVSAGVSVEEVPVDS